MRDKHLLSYSIVLFVLAQIIWFSLLGLFVYRFILSRNILEKVEGQVSISVNSMGNSIFILVASCILYVAVSVAMALIFKNLNTQLRLTRMYDTFIANVTHELKSPLASIQLYLETLQLRDVSKENRQEFVRTMLKDADRLKTLINSILKIAVLEQKRDIFECQIFRADTLIRSIVEETKQHFRLDDAQVEVSGEAAYDCVIDKNALRIVFNNLMDNAIKYNTRPVFLQIHISAQRKKICVHVSDNGIGMPVKDQKKIFHKFQRVHHHYTPNVKGTGLGLYWVKEIIKYHGGSIQVQSEGRDKGTMFKIELPIYKMAKTRYLKLLLKLAQDQKISQRIMKNAEK